MTDVIKPTPKARARELARLVRIETDECVLWPGARTEAGYGDLREGRRHVYAHRRAFEIANSAPKSCAIPAT